MSLKLSTNDRNIILIHSVLFFISLICVIYVNVNFLGLMGCNVGFILGIYLKNKKQLQILKKDLIVIVILAFVAIIVSFLLYYTLREKSIYAVISTNLILLTFAINYIIHITKKHSK
jgi:hypothetical protein